MPPLNYESTTVVVNHLPWLSVLQGRRFLAVYKSVALQTGDPLHKPIQDFLDTTVYTVLEQYRVDDPEMMFGEAEMTVYLISGDSDE